MKNLNSFLIFLLIGIVLNGCRKDEDSSPGTGSQTGNQITTSFSGKVLDLQGSPIQGVQVSVGGKVVSTDANGIYNIQNVSVNSDRAVLTADKAGYWNQQKGIIPQANTVNNAVLVLFPDNKLYTINAASGGVVSLPGGSIITFPANAFETTGGTAYNGTVYLTAHELLTTDNQFGVKIPGGDFLAKDLSGNSQLLVSCGMAGATLYDASGQPLKIATGKQVEIRMPINPTQLSLAPANIPLWYYSEDEMFWKEEGSAVKNGNYYIGSVGHFTWWNVDYTTTSCNVTISITDCFGNPVNNHAFDFRSSGTWQHAGGSTNANGMETVPLPANTIFQLALFQNGSGWNLDTILTVGPFSAGSSNTIHYQLTDGCAQIYGTLKNCNNSIINGNVALLLNNIPVATTITSGGVFNLPYSQQGQYTLVATSGQLTGSASVNVNSSNFGTPITINMNLCDTIATSNNNFTLNFTSGSSSINYSLNVTEAKFQVVSGYKQVVFTYEDSVTGVPSYLTIGTPGYAPGNYAWNSVDSYVAGDITYMGQAGTISSATGSTQFSSIGPIGSPIVGGFGGQVSLQVGGVNLPGYLTATFDVIRTQ